MLDFDQFMSNVQATGAVPYLVLNYDSCNLSFGSGDWTYSQLLALAQSWITYIVKMGYKVFSAWGRSQPTHSPPGHRPCSCHSACTTSLSPLQAALLQRPNREA